MGPARNDRSTDAEYSAKPVDRSDFRFVAIDAAGTAWRWIDEMIWVPVAGSIGDSDREAAGCDVLH